jgi:hypothetical protein
LIIKVRESHEKFPFPLGGKKKHQQTKNGFFPSRKLLNVVKTFFGAKTAAAVSHANGSCDVDF